MEMKAIRVVLLSYGAFLSIFMAVGAGATALQTGNPIFFLLLVPLVVHFLLAILRPNLGHKLLVYYGFVVSSIMGASGFIGANSFPEVISAVLFLPLAIYFWLLVLPKGIGSFNNIAIVPVKTKKAADKPALAMATEEPSTKGEYDLDRRTFLKLVGSTSLAFFVLSLFSNKVGDSIFTRRITGINPPQTNTADNTSDYNISEIDDSNPVYFGFINRRGQWYIMQETESGSFRYSNGDNNFASNWANRSKLQYGYVNAAL